MGIRKLLSYLFFIILVNQTLFSQALPVPNSELAGDFKALLDAPESFSLEEIEAIHLRIKDSVDQLNKEISPESISERQRDRRERDIKGGMMVLSGALMLVGSGVSFALSDKFYRDYNNAESTADAQKYRSLTQSLDAVKITLMVSGAITASASSAYFAGGPDRSQLRSDMNRMAGATGVFFVR